MSGTFRLSQPASSTLQLFPSDPIAKRWIPTQVATRGTREPIFSSIWRFEMDFGAMASADALPFFERRFIAGGLYNGYLPHPNTAALVGFTGIAIEEVGFDWTDVERNSWTDGLRVVLSVNLYATGTV